MELIEYGSKGDEVKYDLLQSAIFGLGVIAQRLGNGEFAHLEQFIKVLGSSISTETEGLDDDEKESKLMLADNSISALVKIVMFQYDGGNVVKDELCSTVLLNKLPLTNDIEEAQAIHTLVLEQVVAKNPVLVKNQEAIKAFMNKVQEYMKTHTEPEEDILGDDGKKLFE